MSTSTAGSPASPPTRRESAVRETIRAMSDASGCPSPEPPATGGGAIRPGRLGVGIISAGRVGAVLGSVLLQRRRAEHSGQPRRAEAEAASSEAPDDGSRHADTQMRIGSSRRPRATVSP